MRIGISLALSVLLAQAVYAEEICTATLGGSSDLTIEKDQVCTISSSAEKVQAQIFNDGTLIFDTNGAKITFTQTDSPYQITSNDRGVISVLKNATFDALTNNSNGSNQGFLIEGQDIKITSSYSLTLKASQVLLGSKDQSTTIVGSSSSVSSSSSWGVTLDSVKSLNLQNAALTNIRLTGSTLDTLININSTLENAHIVSTYSSGLNLKNETNTSSSIKLVGLANTISAGANALGVEGKYQFEGSGTLDFVGGIITLGKTQSAIFSFQALEENSENVATLGFLADNQVVFNNIKTSDLTLQIVKNGTSGAILHNINSSYMNGILQALDRDNKDQILVIENGNTDNLATIGKIGIKGGNTIFKGSGIKVFGQEITLNASSTLALSTIGDNGGIVLGKSNTTATTSPSTSSDVTQTITNADGLVKINGQTGGILQLRSLTTTFGGEVTLQNLQVFTQAKNTQADEGMVFSLDNSSTLILDQVLIKSGIDQDYQDLSFVTSEGSSTLKLSQESAIKASSLSFVGQTISLGDSASRVLSLYSYGNVALDNENGSGVGHFAFGDTSISGDGTEKLKIYSADSAKILASNLTLDNVTLATYKIGTSQKNSLDLSTSGNNLIVHQKAVIDTKSFLYGNSEGVGLDILIDGQKSSQLVLKSEKSGDSFVLGGNLILDNSSVTSISSNPQFEVILDSMGTQSKMSDKKVGLIIEGGLTALGNTQSSTTTTITAKSFVFENDSIVSSIDGTLNLSAVSGSNNIDITQGLTRLFGTSSSSTAKITSTDGILTLGDVQATGSTEISSATFASSNLEILGLGSNANTLSIKNTSEVSGIQSIDITDANLTISNGGNQNLKLNDSAIITSRGTSTITASTITASDGNSGIGAYSINVESGTLTLKETATAGDKIDALTLGEKDKQGGNLALENNTSGYHTFKAPKVTSYNDSTITANAFDFNASEAKLSSTDGELRLISKQTSPNGVDTLTIQKGTLTLDNASLSYYYANSSTETLSKMTLHNGSESVAITSIGDSSIQASELSLNGNTITSSKGVLTLQGLSANSSLGAVKIGNAGGLIATDSAGGSAVDVRLSGLLTLEANAPYVSSTSPIGGGKFGVLQAKSVTFYGNGGVDSPLIQIQVLNQSLVGEELFTLQEGGQVVVWTTDGITKGNGANTPITLGDISLDNGGYKSLALGAELVSDNTKAEQINAIKVNLSVVQNNAFDLMEGIADSVSQEGMYATLMQGNNQAIIDSILLSSSNPLKVGFAENIAQGNVAVVGNALNYINDTFEGIAQSLLINDRIQKQIALSHSSIIESRLAHYNNPHQVNGQIAKLIESYHHTRYASNSEELPQENATKMESNSLWMSYDGGLGTGNGSNSVVNGISAGYDHAFGSQCVFGGFVSYAYGAFDGSYLHNNSHNLSAGLYTRVYSGGNEVDIMVSQNVGFITSEINVGNTTVPSLLNGTMEYDLYRTNVQMRYGYAFRVGDEEDPYYIKPIIGVFASYTYQDLAETNAVASVEMNQIDYLNIEASLGMEVRKYINEGTYFFLMPLVEYSVYGGSYDVNVGFVDSQKMEYHLDNQSKTNVAIYAGGEGNLTENFALNGSLGIKVGIETMEVLTSWSVGLKYKF